MKCQFLFSRINKKKIKMSSTEFLPVVLSVKEGLAMQAFRTLASDRPLL